MKKVVVIGSGLAGLLTAILVARRGFPVTLLEKDDDDLAREAAGSWIRPGVGQATHVPQPERLRLILVVARRQGTASG